MSDDSNNLKQPEDLITQVDVENVCALIRSENIKPWDWLFPAANSCVSCTLITGGHPEMMAGYCPRVNELLTRKMQQNAEWVARHSEEVEKVESEKPEDEKTTR